ncbi:MAG: hypothetical protein Q4C06_03220, partial [Bacillota bacterium]|nr:hypothetical protein [Bacillota bacterium]
SLRPITLQLLQEKVFGRHSIPDGWLLVLTGNPAEYHRGAMEMDAVTADRVRLLWIEPDYAVWKEYMEEKGLDQGVLSYLDSHRKHFYSKREGLRGRYIVTPRAWEDLSVMLHEMQKRGIPVTYPLIAQYISDGRIADSFFTYYCQRERACTSERIRRILRGEENTEDKLNMLSFEAQLSVIFAVLQELRTLAEEAVKRKETAEVVSSALRRIRLACEEGECSFSEGLRDVVQEEEDQAAKAYLMKNWRWLQENEDDWALLQETFFTDIKTPAEAAKDAFAASMQGSISVLLKEIEQDSLLQCFFHELAEEDMIIEMSLHCEIPAMRALFSRVSFSFEEESEMLLQEVKEEKRRNRREAVKRRQEEKASPVVEA